MLMSVEIRRYYYYYYYCYYFAENYGTVETDNKKDNDLVEKCGEFSVNNLKQELKKLKRSNSDLANY